MSAGRTLSLIQIFEAVLDAAVRELPQAAILIGALGNAQDAVKIAPVLKAGLDAGYARDNRGNAAEQKRHQRQADREITAGPLRQRAAAQPAKKTEQTCVEPVGYSVNSAKNARR